MAAGYRVLASLLVLLAAAAPQPTAAAAPHHHRIGIMYEGWHGPAVTGLKPGVPHLTVEDVVRSNGSASMADLQAGVNASAAWGFNFHKQPADGFYCIYRKRANETSGVLPDCANITATLTRHAAMLVAANVSFVVADSTNFEHFTPSGDAIQLRPIEVLFEEWAKLRAQGLPTPQIAAWQKIADPAGDLWRKFADGVYADPSYADLVMRDAHTGKKVFFVVGSQVDSTIEKTLQDQYGFAVVRMWALFNDFSGGEWGFFSPCRVDDQLATDVANMGARPCDQGLTTGSPIGPTGTALTVGPSYQLSYSSLPWLGAGKYFGLTLKKQFEKAFATQPDYLFVGTFNEHIAQPQPNPYYPGLPAKDMGLEQDPAASAIWVDMYGDGITRDLEPTVEDGGAAWALFQSCMRAYQHALATGARTCSLTGEPCCDAANPLHTFNLVHSFSLGGDSGDHLLTADDVEVAALRKEGWAEICPPLGGARAVCAGGGVGVSEVAAMARAPLRTAGSDFGHIPGQAQLRVTNASAAAPAPAAVSALNYVRGPFKLHAGPVTSGRWTSTTAVYRCYDGSRHFFSADAGCRGVGRHEAVLGYTCDQRTSHAARSLRLCRGAAGYYYSSLDAPCQSGDSQLEYLGYVR